MVCALTTKLVYVRQQYKLMCHFNTHKTELVW